MRLLSRAATAAATTVLGVGAAALAAGRYTADAVLRPGPRSVPPGLDGTPLTVLDVRPGPAGEPGEVLLTGEVDARRPGVYGITGDDCHAVVGPPLDEPDGGVASGAPGPPVRRRLLAVVRGRLGPGTTVRLTPQAFPGDPRRTLGLDHLEVTLPGDLGPLPAWVLPGWRPTWVITVHGLGTTREHPLVVAPFLARTHLPVLVPAHRGDPGAPRPPDGRFHLGHAEWPDLVAAMRFAVTQGAERLVLYGWSTGATMALLAAARAELRDRVSGLVLDCPVLDPRDTVRRLAAARGTPRRLLPLVEAAVRGVAPDLLPADGPGAPLAAPTVPTLLLHSPEDTVAPWRHTRALERRNPRLTTLHTVRDAPHAALWNTDPAGYEETLRRFLTPLL